jgi:hypothetical protein
MACIIDAKSTRGRPARLAAGLAVAACLALGTFAGSANAQGQNRGQENHDQDKNRDQDNRGGDRRDGDRGNEGWGGNSYNAPPVVYYQTPSYYAPPPVVYGPGFGININIQ